MNLNRDIREVIRHAIIRTGLNGAYLALRAARGQNVEHLRQRNLAERFSTIYRNRIWLDGRAQGSLSGIGSDFESTRSIRLHLPDLLARLGAKALLDVGCGDFHWMRELALGCDYIGVDCVQAVIDRNAAAYGSANRSFFVLDATTDTLPKADTVLCREMLFHLSFTDIAALMRNVRASGASTLIATTDGGTQFNSDIRSGDFRILNLSRSPLNFPPPTLSIPDDGVLPGRALGVWQLSECP